MIIHVGKNILPDRTGAELLRSISSLCDALILNSSLPLSWWKANAQEDVTVEINDVVEFSGRIDSLTEITDTQSVRVFIRDRTSDLIDCPHIGTGEFKNITPLQILKKIVTPFGITIENDLDSNLISFFGHGLDEKCFILIRRLAQSVGWTITSNGQGGLLHWETDTPEISVQIEKGKNANFQLKYDYTKSFSTYKVLGQGQFSKGQFQLIKQVSGSSERYRPYVFISETTTDGERVSQEAKRIKDYIEGGALSATINYYGDERILPGQKITLISEDIKEQMYVESVRLLKKEKDRETIIKVVMPGRFGDSE